MLIVGHPVSETSGKGWAAAIPPARENAPQAIRRRSNRIAIKTCPFTGKAPAGSPLASNPGRGNRHLPAAVTNCSAAKPFPPKARVPRLGRTEGVFAMGLLVDGVWTNQWYDTSKSGGRFERSVSQFRDWVTKDGAPAQGRSRGFRAEPGRYHLYVSLACPWAHRTLIVRKLKKLEDVISVDVVHHYMGDDGWTFLKEDGATGDSLFGSDFLHQIYTRADRAGAVGQEGRHDRLQRIVGDHPHAELGLRRMGRRFGRPLPRRLPRGDRRDKRAHLSLDQQWRLSRRFRHDARRL
jgi:hypothetical protein